ncbi:Farnesyl pyrophosphate synthetase [Entomophthora muscae]|uniref:Farnesyl pyrophosphate synthetase n=1 Tax=Entomophthora muscae TaxID=34485 RepID=A0ACC2SHJ8_9FUNG|nr:Farnesyl pyrophosphate synthetase [Entomophthora muscae]
MNRDKFISVFDTLAQDILLEIKEIGLPTEAYEWVKKSLYYSVPGGKLNRGLSVVDTVKIIRGDKVTEEELFKAAILGWCTELLQAFFLVSDDLMDSSITRRGQPCWYRLEGVGTIAVNDAFMLEGAIYRILKKHFKGQTYYGDLVDIFLETSWKTEIGQLVDLLTAPEHNVDFSRFSLEKQMFISKYKTAYYSFHLPVALALIMTGTSDETSLKKSADILVPIGEYFQIQDDYLDCYGAPEVIGKIGTDIEDNKCSWLINMALRKATPEQRAILEANYGHKDQAKVAAIKAIYRDLELEKEYTAYEDESYQKLTNMINQLAGGKLNPKIYITFLNKVYKRSK